MCTLNTLTRPAAQQNEDDNAKCLRWYPLVDLEHLVQSWQHLISIMEANMTILSWCQMFLPLPNSLSEMYCIAQVALVEGQPDADNW